MFSLMYIWYYVTCITISTVCNIDVLPNFVKATVQICNQIWREAMQTINYCCNGVFKCTFIIIITVLSPIYTLLGLYRHISYSICLMINVCRANVFEVISRAPAIVPLCALMVARLVTSRRDKKHPLTPYQHINPLTAGAAYIRVLIFY